MATFAQTSRLLTFTSPLGKDKLLPERMTGTEGISELFCYQLDLLAAVYAEVDPKTIVGKRVCVGISADDSGTQRYVNGIVSSLEMMNVDEEFASYRATIVPSLWMLTLNKNTRCYQNKTVVDIIKDVLSPYSISPSVQTSNTYTPLEYCTQYRETDFDFVSRLMEQHGIFYYFQHTADDHTLNLQDTSNKLNDCPIQDKFKFRPESGEQEGYYDFVVDELSSRSTLVTGKHSAWDYSFVRYQTVMGTSMNTAGPLGANSNEDYDYAETTPYYKLDASDTNLKSLEDAFTTVRRDVSDAGTLIVEGESNAICMQTGYSFTLTEHKQSALNIKYLLNHIELSVQQIPSYRSKADAPKPFINRFIATPFSIVYRPPFKTEKPVVYGMHTGQVIVPSGEESHMDKYGRVNVQFWWDRLRKANTPDNTWLRVAQSWASKGWGTYYWPRVGDEVLVGFMEGDPDQPIVVGSIYNGANMPPYDPVGQYTLSGIVTRSSKGGGAANANELRFEDLTGKEQIYINAERDFDIHVEHDNHVQVDNEQHITIKKNRFDEVDGDSHLLIKGKHLEEIDGDAHLNIKGKNVVQVGGDREHNVTGNLKESFGQNSNITVGQNLNESVGQNYSLTVGMKQAIQAGMNFDVTAPMQISLNCGMNSIVLSPEGIGLNGAAGFISIGPSGVTISGVMVMINSGGAPVSGSPGSAQSAQTPGSATAPTAPSFPGDKPYSTAQSGSGGSAGAAAQVTDSGGGGAAAPPSPAGAAAGAANEAEQAANQAEQQAQQAVNQLQQAANQAAQQASQVANQAAQQAQQAAQQAQQAAQQAEQQAQQAVNQVMQQARQTYNQAQQAVNQAEQQVQQAAAQGQQAAQQALNQAKQAANQAAQQAAAAVQQAQQQAQQVAGQAQQAAQQAQQQAQQAAQQAQQAANQAQQQAQQAVQQAQQQAQQAAQQGQQAVQQAQQQAQQAAQQAQQAAQQAVQQGQQAAQQAAQQAQQAANQAKQAASGAQQQVTQAASGAQQQAQQAAQQAQQSAQQAINSATHGF